MAEYRQIHTRIWKDNWFCDLSDAGKLLFIYLFSNERASVSGIYELPLKYIVFETGIAKAEVEKLLKEFERAGKVHYESGIVWVVNLRKYNESASPKVQTRLDKDIAAIPDSNILKIYCQHFQIQYPYSIHTTSGNDERNGNETEQETDTDTDTEKEKDGGADAPKPPTPAELECEVLELWQALFPNKPQPRPGTYRSKIATRFKSEHFKNNWRDALSKASLSPTLQEESWLDMEFFTRNEENYQKCLDNWMAWKDNERVNGKSNGNGSKPAAPAKESATDILQRLKEQALQEEASNGKCN